MGVFTQRLAEDIMRNRDLAGMRMDFEAIRQSRFGKIGTSGRIPVSFRVDHQIDEFIEHFGPLFKARALPLSVGLVTKSVGNPSAAYEPTTATWEDVRTQIQDIGGEIWSHSQTHSDPGVNGSTSLYDEIVESKRDIEAQGIGVMGFQQPGGPATYGPFRTMADYNSPDGRLIRETYPLIESYRWGTEYRVLPSHGVFGDSHFTLDTATLDQAKEWIEMATMLRRGVQFMWHPKFLLDPGGMGLAVFEQFLDHVVALRDAGEVEVLTASGLAFADLESDHRPSVVPYGDFERAPITPAPPAWAYTQGLHWDIRTDGGRSGQNYLHFAADATTQAACRVDTIRMQMQGAPYEFRGWFRRRDAAATIPNVRVMYFTSRANFQGPVYTPQLTTQGAWQQIRFSFVPPADTNFIMLYIKRHAGGALDVDDVEIVAV